MGTPQHLRVAIGVDLAGLPPEVAVRVEPLGLETKVVQRLIQEGFAVVAPFAQPHVLLTAESLEDEPGLRLWARTENAAEAVKVVFGAGTLAELQLEVAQKLVDLARTRAHAVARRMEEEARRAEAEAKATPALRPVIIPQVPPPQKREEVFISVGVGADGVWRGALDPGLRLGVALEGDLPPTGGLPLGAAFNAQVSTSSETWLSVLEWQVAAGPRLRLVRSELVWVHLSILAGVVGHGWTATGVGVDAPEGHQVDVLLSVPVEVDFPLGDLFKVGLRLAPGIAGRAREHRRNEEVWRREAARLEAGLTLAVRL